MLTPWKKSYDQPRQHIKNQRHYYASKGPSSQGYGFPVVMYGCESWTVRKAECWRIDAFELWCWRRLLRVPWIARRSNQSILKEISLKCSLEGLMLTLKLLTLVTWCEELTHLKRPWCWERLKVGGEGDDRGWDCWMSSLNQWTWACVSSRSWWWTGRPGVLQSMGSQRVEHDWVTELNWSKEHEQSIFKIPEIPNDFQGRVFKGNINGMGCRVPDKTLNLFSDWLLAERDTWINIINLVVPTSLRFMYLWLTVS